ncbi:MAG TPA: hypothetical protein VF950_05665 [Planctomycetota bacterium]
MDGKKVFIVVLVLLAALFAVGVVLGAARSDPPSKDPERDPSGFERTLDGLVGSMKSKAKLAAKEFAQGTSTSVGPSDQAMRTLKLRIAKTCRIVLTYQRGPNLKPSKMDRQPWDPEDKEIKNKESTSFVILKEGGTITFGTCATHKNSACKVFVVED